MSATSTTPVCSTPSRGFGPLRCLLCGEVGKVSVDLDDVTDAEALQCRECDGVFGLADVRTAVEGWQRVLSFLDAAPVLNS